MPAATAILPFPLSATALFGYGILRFLGHVSDDTHVRFAHVAGSPSKLFTCQGKIIELRLRTSDLYLEVLGLTGSDPQLKRILTFACHGDKEMRERLESVLHKLNTENRRKALSLVSQLIATSMETKSDMWKSTKGFEAFVTTLSSLPTRLPTTYPPDKRIMSLPVFKGKKEGVRTEDDVTESFEVVLEEGRICTLQGKHIGIVIGGPPQSGKSTLAVSLVAEMQNWITTLQTRRDFEGLNVTVGRCTLDLATPTTEAIAEGWANIDSQKLTSMKQPWTPRLAKRAQERFLESRGKYNIVVGDLPGRVTEITELLVSTADACIILSNDWDIVQKEWIPLMNTAGVPIISKVRRRETGDGYSSLVTSWRKGERFSGRVTALNRTQKSWDLFIQWLALFLLFDVLPTQFGE